MFPIVVPTFSDQGCLFWSRKREIRKKKQYQGIEYITWPPNANRKSQLVKGILDYRTQRPLCLPHPHSHPHSCKKTRRRETYSSFNFWIFSGSVSCMCFLNCCLTISTTSSVLCCYILTYNTKLIFNSISI